MFLLISHSNSQKRNNLRVHLGLFFISCKRTIVRQGNGTHLTSGNCMSHARSVSPNGRQRTAMSSRCAKFAKSCDRPPMTSISILPSSSALVQRRRHDRFNLRIAQQPNAREGANLAKFRYSHEANTGRHHRGLERISANGEYAQRPHCQKIVPNGTASRASPVYRNSP